MGIARTVVIGLAALGGLGLLVDAGTDDSIIVESVIDGDTIDVSQDGETTRVRLLNVDTPEIGRNGKSSECLAEEAHDYLREILPVGTEVALEYDIEREDRYGRTLAGVFVDDMLVNAEIAREGLGVAVEYAPNRKFYQPVADAEAEAAARSVGISTLGPECIVEDPVVAEIFVDSQEVVDDAANLVGEDLDDIYQYKLAKRHLTSLEGKLRTLSGLSSRMVKQTEFQKQAFGDRFDELVDEEKQRAKQIYAELESAIESEDQRRADEEAERERERKEAEREREREEDQREREREAAERASASTSRVSTPAADPAPRQAPAVAPQPSAPAVDKYTGCRAYGGDYALTSTDNKGRPYAKIDCKTKIQIG